MTGNDIAKISGGFTTVCSLLLGAVFIYCGPIIGITVASGLALIVMLLMWNRYLYFISQRELNRLSSFELLIRRIGLTFSAVGLIAFSTFFGYTITNKVNTSMGKGDNNLKSQPAENTINQNRDTDKNQNYLPKDTIMKSSITDSVATQVLVDTQVITDNSSSRTDMYQGLTCIRAEKSYFFKDTNENIHLAKRKRSYCVKGDSVIVLESTPNWSKVSYNAGSGSVTEGWILNSDLK